MIPGRGKPLTNETSESGKFSPLMLFDCRGYEPIDFIFSTGWKVESLDVTYMFSVVPILSEKLTYRTLQSSKFSTLLEGTKFENVDLSSGDFTEYDEKGECPVMISNLRATFDVVK
ncbi:hypothetical protein L195_g035528 [Trifolium pratense]|uniref:Uncharacterized protein n=1 Tax=Trifolium pratense TaxID=57577 RepID=A0A2K3LLZ2_TRIPR|nr:hypothetical protein L195_g035528 [Trifolium pratense]